MTRALQDGHPSPQSKEQSQGGTYSKGPSDINFLLPGLSLKQNPSLQGGLGQIPSISPSGSREEIKAEGSLVV